MSASLVGSEMCIRDRPPTPRAPPEASQEHGQSRGWSPDLRVSRCDRRCPVSYTHLTLPTICSV
eukprot:2047317-Alexandrium_andersonii.AAC.1